MTSTSGFTEGLSRVGLSRISTFKQKTNSWPEVHLSIGKGLCLIGTNRCWEAVGPAKEQFSQVNEPIRQLLESQHEQLNKDISVRNNIFLDIYMIGPTEEQARPTVIFSCENKTQRQRAQKLVKSSNILDKYTGFRLGNSPRPPRTNMSPRPLGDEADFGMELESSTSELLVYHSSPIRDVYGIPIFIQKANAQNGIVFRKSTLGGIISIHSKFFGLTVAHVFSDDDDEENGSRDYDAIELSLEDEDEDIFWGSNEDDLIETTSRGSLSPRQDPDEDSESSLSIESVVLDLEIPNAPYHDKGFEHVIQQTQNGQSTATSGLERTGPLTRTSFTSQQGSLDWALVEITSLEIIQAYGQLNTIAHVKSIIKSLPMQNTPISAVTVSGGKTTGTITNNPTFMQLTTGITFQEVWTVQLDSTIGYGDCGSWVTSPDGQSLYGYVTAGDPSTSLAYIIPAYQAFSDIELSMDGQITFPVLDALPKDLVIWSDVFCRPNAESSMNVRRNLFPLDFDYEEVDETSEGEGQFLWDEVIGLVKRTLSSRPTTPSDSFTLDSSHEESSSSDLPTTSDQFSSDEFLNLDTPASKSNPPDCNSIMIGNQLPTICEWVHPSLDAESSSLTGLSKSSAKVSSNKSCAQLYVHNPKQTHQHCRDIAQRPLEEAQHKTNLVDDTKFSPSPQTRMHWAYPFWNCETLACVPGSPCENCNKIVSKISMRNQPRLNEPLESLAGFLVPRYLFAHLTKANVEHFVTANVVGWGKQSIAVKLYWGYQRHLDIEVVPLIPRQTDSFDQINYVHSIGINGQRVKQKSPPLGILLADIDDMKYGYHKYIQDIVDGDLFGYLPATYIDQESEFPERLLTAICSYYTAASEKGRQIEILLRRAIEMHVTATILERALLLDETSQKAVEELLGESFPESSAPRVAQRQIKLAIFMTQTARIRDVLHGWGKLMSKSVSSKNLVQDWPTAICVFLMMVLVMDKIIGAAWYFCEGNIRHDRRDAVEERKQFMELVTLAQTELFERCKEIFHSRYNTRDPEKSSFNPVRDGVEAWRGQMGQMGQMPNAEVKELTWNLQKIVRDFETEIRQHGSGVEDCEFLYAGRLACIFLEDLLSNER